MGGGERRSEDRSFSLEAFYQQLNILKHGYELLCRKESTLNYVYYFYNLVLAFLHFQGYQEPQKKCTWPLWPSELGLRNVSGPPAAPPHQLPTGEGEHG